VQRLIKALAAGQEICETILNYRRDGSPFMNLLMTAPLYDNKGAVRYFLGCQIDVSSLVEGGRGLESFAQLLARDRSESRFGGRQKDAKHALSELGGMLTEEESNMVKSQTRRGSEETGLGASALSHRPTRGGRKILGMDDTAAERGLWPDRALGPSGRLPGVYQNVSLTFHLQPRCACFQLNTNGSCPTVPPRPPLPLPPHHLHLPRPPHPGPPANQIPRAHRRPTPRPRGDPRRSLAWHRRHGENHLAHSLCYPGRQG